MVSGMVLEPTLPFEDQCAEKRQGLNLYKRHPTPTIAAKRRVKGSQMKASCDVFSRRHRIRRPRHRTRALLRCLGSINILLFRIFFGTANKVEIQGNGFILVQ